MEIFISWSKDRSMEFAIKTKEVLEKLDSHIHTFVSEVDIIGGDDVQKKIISKIKECDILVLCFTKENKKSPWLLFEAGYAKGRKKKIIPLLFDDDPNWHSWVDNPMNISKQLSFEMPNFANNFLHSFDIHVNNFTISEMQLYIETIKEIKEKYRQVDIKCEDFVNKLIDNGNFVVENPFFQDRTAHFLTGFESYDLYKEIIDSFMYSGKYLWIYGRKNMKLFGGNYKVLFNYLIEKIACNPQMAGIDFRCLFLDPRSDEVARAHPQQRIFRSELENTIIRAKDIVQNNSVLETCLRLYANKREEIIIRLDNCIIYSKPVFDSNGMPELITNTSFEVFSIDSTKGKECVMKFENVWNKAKPFSELKI